MSDVVVATVVDEKTELKEVSLWVVVSLVIEREDIGRSEPLTVEGASLNVEQVGETGVVT